MVLLPISPALCVFWLVMLTDSDGHNGPNNIMDHPLSNLLGRIHNLLFNGADDLAIKSIFAHTMVR